jgi:hypothetical protein
LRLGFLIGIEVVAFALIILETYVFFAFIVPIGPFPHNLREYTAFTLLKIILTFGLGALWFLVMIALTRIYVRARIGARTPTPSS